MNEQIEINQKIVDDYNRLADVLLKRNLKGELGLAIYYLFYGKSNYDEIIDYIENSFNIDDEEVLKHCFDYHIKNKEKENEK